MKKLFAVLMSIVLVFTMGAVALAADAGSITISNAENGMTYDIYKMLDFEPIAGETDKGVYTAVEGWEDFFTTEPATNYFDTEVIGEDLVVALKKDVDKVDQTLAQAAIEYATDNNIVATNSATAGDEEVKFTNLDLGYYAINTSLGALCALTNTNSDETLFEKNAKPDIDKFVQEDREKDNADEGWGKVNDADINQVVNYKSTITVGYGATGYVMHDTMDNGLTFDPDSVSVDGATADVDYTVVYPATDGHTFDIVFEDAFIATFERGETFTVYYSATLNKDAKIVYDKGADDYEGNMNTVYLEYFNEVEWETDEHKTVTYTWKLDAFKYTMDGKNKTPLAGATFQLVGADGPIKFTKIEDTTTYYVDPNGTTDIVTGTTGEFTFIGLDEGTYTLVETDAPDGYNLAKDTVIVIGSDLDDKNMEADYYFYNAEGETDADKKAEPTTIEVENKTGGLFPETGGIGTTIFYIVGALLMLAAVVVLVSKKRMATFA